MIAPRRGRHGGSELTLEPFIDLMATCLTFLLLTAVWVQVEGLQLDQQPMDPGGCGLIPDPDPLPPLIVHVRSDGVWSGRTRAGGGDFRGGDAPDWAGLRAFLERDRALYPEDPQVVILTDDGVAYGETIRAIDLTRSLGYEKSLLGGGKPEGG